MGIILGRFRKKKSTYEVLEKLEDEISSIDTFKKSTETRQKKIVRGFLVFGLLIYIGILAALYFNFSRFKPRDKILCFLPLVVLPLVIWYMKRILTWYYSKKIKKNENKLVSLKEQKKKLIDNVMETETYKVAKTILDKFAPEPKKTLELTPFRPNNSSFAKPDSNLRHRYIPQARGRLSIGTPISSLGPNAHIVQRSAIANKQPMVKSATIGESMGLVPGTPLPKPRAVLPRDRSVLDKMVDYLVGDGPSNRFALICKDCSGHNGMALREEFEYLAFKCCYCHIFNPARKKKPSAPKLGASVLKPSDSSESDSSSTDSEDSNQTSNIPIVTEPEEPEEDNNGKLEPLDNDEGNLLKKGSDTESSPMDVDAETDP